MDFSITGRQGRSKSGFMEVRPARSVGWRRRGLAPTRGPSQRWWWLATLTGR